MLEVRGLSAGYGDLTVVRDVSIDVAEGEFVAIIGSNAAGKSTLIRSMIGLLPRAAGTIKFDGHAVERLAPYELAQRGLAVVLEHAVIAKMTVHDNLLLGAYRSQARAEINSTLDESFALFPILAERRTQLAGSLSGGEQQMLCVARALMSRPRMIVLDEPSVGLSPVMVSTILQSLAALNKRGLTILLAEQNVVQTLKIATRAYVIEGGAIRMQAPSAELMNNPACAKPISACDPARREAGISVWTIARSGRSGLKVSPICVGSFNFSNPTPEAESTAIVERAYAAGINFFDTSNNYNEGEANAFLAAPSKRWRRATRSSLPRKCIFRRTLRPARTSKATRAPTSSVAAKSR